MSVKVHEPVCEDSAQDLYFWFDHFLGDQLKDEWREAGTGSATVVDAQTGGIVRLTTGAITGNNYYIDWGDIKSLLVANKTTMECRVKLNQTTLELQRFGLIDVGPTNDWIYWRYDTAVAHTNWHNYLGNTASGAGLILDTGITVDTDYHIFRIECFPNGEIHWYIDGVETDNSPRTTNIPLVHLQPWFSIYTRENVTKSMDIDYCVVRQER